MRRIIKGLLAIVVIVGAFVISQQQAQASRKTGYEKSGIKVERATQSFSDDTKGEQKLMYDGYIQTGIKITGMKSGTKFKVTNDGKTYRGKSGANNDYDFKTYNGQLSMKKWDIFHKLKSLVKFNESKTITITFKKGLHKYTYRLNRDTQKTEGVASFRL